MRLRSRLSLERDLIDARPRSSRGTSEGGSTRALEAEIRVSAGRGAAEC